MNASQSHPAIAFASRYSGYSQHYLSAFTAIVRMTTLLDDVRTMRVMEERARATHDPWLPWYGTETYSYYAVGYVTCLEWHARSRLLDVLSHDPSTLRPDDLKGAINDKLVVQMVSEKASVSQLVAASLKVGSVDRYLSIMGRLFEALRFGFTPAEWLFGNTSQSNACWLKPDQLATIQQVFDFRHDLVHEIGPGTTGHWNIRTSWDWREASSNGRIVAAMIAGIEAALTAFAPPRFPNLLEPDGYPVSSAERLQREMLRLELVAEQTKPIWSVEMDGDASKRDLANAKFHEYLKAELAFIDEIRPPFWRYMDITIPMRERLYQHRIDMTQYLLSQLVDQASDNPDRNSKDATG